MTGWDMSLSVVRTLEALGPWSSSFSVLRIEDELSSEHAAKRRVFPFQSFSGLYLNPVPGNDPIPVIFVEHVVGNAISGCWYGRDHNGARSSQDFIPLFKGFDFPCQPKPYR